MTIAPTLQQYLDQRGMVYDLCAHPHTHCSMETAQAAHIPGKRLAKAVLVEQDDTHYLMVVVPSSHHVDLARLHRHFGQLLGLATEAELAALFPDCEIGAVPALGMAYGLNTVWDSALAEQPEIYLEGGDHENLLRLDGPCFRQLFADVPHGRFSDALG